MFTNHCFTPYPGNCWVKGSWFPPSHVEWLGDYSEAYADFTWEDLLLPPPYELEIPGRGLLSRWSATCSVLLCLCSLRAPLLWVGTLWVRCTLLLILAGCTRTTGSSLPLLFWMLVIEWLLIRGLCLPSSRGGINPGFRFSVCLGHKVRGGEVSNRALSQSNTHCLNPDPSPQTQSDLLIQFSAICYRGRPLIHGHGGHFILWT